MNQSVKDFFTRKNLAILGVVTLIVLGLYFIGGVGASNAPSETQAAQYCQDRCDSIQETSGQLQRSEMYSYCKDTLQLGSGAPATGPQLKEANSQYCSDAARCPNVNTCEVSGQTLDMQGCIDFMTTYHEEQLDEDPEQARQHTEDLLSQEDENGVGTCEEKPDWYTEEIQ